MIIENGARWMVENFVLSRYNHRLAIIAMIEQFKEILFYFLE